jgi:thiol-disulfide isomerase/thioredoxin
MKNLLLCGFLFLSLISFSSNHLICAGATCRARISKNVIIYVFSGSDWCAKCMMLEKKILSDSVFLNGLRSSQVKLEKIDFPQRKKLSPEVKKYNESIAEKLEFNGAFPTIVVFSSMSGKQKSIPYQGESSADFFKKLIDEAAKLYE